MNLTKIPYEISLWEDRLTLVDVDGNEYDNFVNLDVQVETQYYKEKKLCVIGADTMDSIFRVVEPKLVRKTDGTSTLTFSIYAKCYDEETNEFVQNPYLKYLTNERKVKLKYYPNGELRWLDFIIKKIDESSENYKFTYTATDLFINELSKTGYKLEFDQEQKNNQGTVQELAGRILETTDWMVGEDSEIIQQLKAEPLYAIELLNDEFIAYDIFTNEELIITNNDLNKTIYAFYSSIAEGDPEYFQFIYNKSGIYDIDENGVAHNVGNYYCKKDSIQGTPVYYNGFRGEKYVRTQRSEYDKTLEQYVKVYEKNGKKYYGYTKSEYIQPSLITNYVTNGNHILSTSGWQQEMDGSLKITTYPPIDQASDSRSFGIEFVQRTEDSQDGQKNTYLLNSGFRDNLENIKEISTNQTYAFQFCGDLNKKYPKIWIAKYKLSEGNGIQITETLLSPCVAGYSPRMYEDKEEGKTYGFWYNLHFNRAISYKELTDTLSEEKIGIFLNFVNSKNEPINGSCFIEKFEFFPQFNGRAKDDQEIIEGIILPNGRVLDAENQKISKNIAETYVDTKYYYYVPLLDKTTKPEEIQYEYIGIENKEYAPVYNSNFEKIRSISKKETNRFDLLQTLSETFECWCRFDIWHNENGEIICGKDLNLLLNAGGAPSNEKLVFLGGDAYSIEEIILTHNDIINPVYEPYQQLKFVTFHKQIGQKKNIGFKYGMNLKSLSRNLDSNDIATKLIVKSNTNEFANGGSCNIALAKENPSGENFIYDFSHYINQGLMNQDNLNNDLYFIDNTEEAENRKWIGLYTKLKRVNTERDLLITEQSGLVGSYSKYKSTYENAKIYYNASLEQLEDLENQFYDNTGSSYNGVIPDKWKDSEKIIGIVFNIERLQSELIQLKKDYEDSEKQLNAIEARLNELSDILQNMENQTAELIAQFENKYSRFIQEASWTSEDYIDDNLYYLDAEKTLHKSAQPKVSYTINVIDLSQLEEYKKYQFDLGDITYVQDTDFFGWINKEGIKTPYKEEIVITEQTILFEEPDKGTIKAQNYRTAFEDLFQRLTASAQQLQFHGGEYQRAANSMDSMGNILPGCLQDAFANNTYVLANAANQSVKWDDKGITTTNTAIPTEVLRITSGGIFLTEDGERWTTGITAQGINANVITTGTLNTGVVNIYNGAAKSFTWDSNGLNAYQQDGDGYSLKDFVRFNQYGVFGIKDCVNDESVDSIEKIKEKAGFYLGWDGLTVREGAISIFNNNNGIIIDPLQKIYNNGTVFSITSDSEIVVSIDNEGAAKFKGEFAAGDFSVTKEQVKFTDNFTVDKSGNVKLTGTITAEDGSIGGFKIGSNFIASEIKEGRQVLISNGAIGLEKNVVFGVRNGDEHNWPFWVGGTGILHATGAEISGTITASTISGTSIDNGNGTFSVKENGYLTASSGTIGGFELGPRYIKTKGVLPGDPTIGTTVDGKPVTFIGLYNAFFTSDAYPGDGGYVTIAGHRRGDWRFIIGKNFGVAYDGTICATGANFSGTITASTINNGSTFSVTPEGYLTATSGEIGCLKIDANKGLTYDASGTNMFKINPTNSSVQIGSLYVAGVNAPTIRNGRSLKFTGDVNAELTPKKVQDLSGIQLNNSNRLELKLLDTTDSTKYAWYTIAVKSDGTLIGVRREQA